MTVSLKLENDEELRAYVKDLIKGQMMSVIREETLNLVQAELTRKVKGMDIPYFERLVKEALNKHTKDYLDSASRNLGALLQPAVFARVDEMFTNEALTESLVNSLVQKKFQELIKTVQ
jgi:hypothetical protein